MSSADRGAAQAALDAARSAIGRLDPSRHPEEIAADLLDAWASMEDALRQRVGAGAAHGIDLVREARQRQLLSFDQANALAAFHAVRERTQESGYTPTTGDVDAARSAMAALDAAPAAAPESPAPEVRKAPAPLEHMLTPPGMRKSPIGGPEFVPPPGTRRSQPWWWIAVVLVLLVAAGGGTAYYWFGGPRRDAVVQRAMDEYDAGNRQAAATDFRRVLLIDPGYTIAHVYLARIARDQGNLPAANAELQLALTGDPTNALALREMGSYLYTVGHYDLARKFYVRAVEANPEDVASMGFLGCTLIKLGRIDEGERWITRAGPGVWTQCVGASTPPDTLHH